MFNTTDRRKVVLATLKWLSVQANSGYRIIDQTYLDFQAYADVDHSALLERLLSGKDPLPFPPPLVHSYPWYEIIEDGRAEISSDSFIGPYREDGSLVWDMHDGARNVYVHGSPWVLDHDCPLDLRDLDDGIRYRDAIRTPGEWRVRYKGSEVIGKKWNKDTDTWSEVVGDMWEIFRTR